MNKKEFKKVVKKAKAIYTWTNIFGKSGGTYVKVMKNNLLAVIRNMDNDIEFHAGIHEKGRFICLG